MDMDMNDHGDSDDTNGDGEGVWSPDIEQCFREALLLFPPCGRRKSILHEEGGGKMYGRNELIARHIMMRTGKSRTRKQVSSHIQVLARRKAKAEAASNSSGVSPSPSGLIRPNQSQSANRLEENQLAQRSVYYDEWADRPIVTQKIRLVEFSAFIEHRNLQSSNGGAVITANIQQQQPQLPIVTTTASGPAGNGTILTSGSTTGQDLSLQANQQAVPIQSYPAQQHQVTHPLASNHHLPAQFNQASYMANNSMIQSHNHQKFHPAQDNQCLIVNPHSLQQQQQQQSFSGFNRHSYIQIDYTQAPSRQAKKLEEIDIREIQDKFPGIGGTEGLFQRGPADAFFLVKFWADLNNDYNTHINNPKYEDQNSYFGFSSHFETIEPYKEITCSTKACSYGHQVVEKVAKIYGAFNSSNGRFSYDINRSPMCEFLIQFIKKLRQLPQPSQMNSVLENFTVLQVITSESTSEILLCLAYVFEVASTEQNNGPQYHVYKLTKD